MFRSLAAASLPALPAPGVLLRSLRALVAVHLSAILSATGALCGIAGTALLAVHAEQVASVFALYLGAAASWMGVGYLTRQRWLLASNLVYFALAVKGLLF